MLGSSFYRWRCFQLVDLMCCHCYSWMLYSSTGECCYHDNCLYVYNGIHTTPQWSAGHLTMFPITLITVCIHTWTNPVINNVSAPEENAVYVVQNYFTQATTVYYSYQLNLGQIKFDQTNYYASQWSKNTKAFVQTIFSHYHKLCGWSCNIVLDHQCLFIFSYIHLRSNFWFYFACQCPFTAMGH